MNKATFFILFSCLTFFGFSQEGDGNKMYFNFNAGYSVPVSKSTVGSPRLEVGSRLLVESEQGTYTFSEKNPFGTRGAGINLGGAFGYKLSDHFAFEMEFNFLRSAKILDASKDFTDAAGLNYFASQYSYTNMLRVAPMLVVSGNSNKKFTPYAKFGVLLPLAGKTIVEVDIIDKTGVLANQLLPVLDEELYNDIQELSSTLGISVSIPTDNYIRAKTSGSFSVGFTSRIGCAYNINSRASIFSELSINMLTVKAKDTKFVEFSSKVSDPSLVDLTESLLGRSIKSEYGFYDLPEILRVTNYVNEITQDSNFSYNPANKDEAFEQLTFRDNYNSLGIAIGFKYNF